jgi:hypothetical protein
MRVLGVFLELEVTLAYIYYLSFDMKFRCKKDFRITTDIATAMTLFDNYQGYARITPLRGWMVQ